MKTIKLINAVDLLICNFRSALQEVLVHLLKHTEPHEALTLLYALAFKQNPQQKLTPTETSANTNADDVGENENFSVNFMSDNFVFGYGDNGGVIIKGQSNDSECVGPDNVLRNLRGDGLSDSEVRALCIVELLRGLKKDSLAGDFFIYLMQELTNLISDFSEDMGSEGTVNFFHMN